MLVQDMPNKKSSWSQKTSVQKEYAIRKWFGIPISVVATWIIYKFVLIDFLVKMGWINKSWAIIIAIIVFFAAFGWWIEDSNKSQFYETNKDGMKIRKS